MPRVPRRVRNLVAAFLLYLAVSPVWNYLESPYCGLAIGLTEMALPWLEYPHLTERLEFDGAELRVFSPVSPEPVGEWKDIEFPFYIPFLLLVILLFPGIPWRDRLIGAGIGLAALMLLHMTLIFTVVQQVHQEFFQERGARLFSPLVAFGLSFQRKFLFNMGNQMFSGATILFLFLLYGRAGPRPPEKSSTLRPAFRQPWKLPRAAAIIVSSALLAILLLTVLLPALKRRSPRYEGIQQVLGHLHQRQGHLPEAEMAFRAAIQSNPANAQTQNNLGVVLFLQERWEEARIRFSLSLARDPGNPQVQGNMGKALIRLGRGCDALAYLADARPRLAGTREEISGEFLQSALRQCAQERDRVDISP